MAVLFLRWMLRISLKPVAHGTLRTIELQLKNTKKHIEKDAALSRQHQKIKYYEGPSVADSIAILEGAKENYEAHHKVTITDQAIETAVKYAHRSLTSKHLGFNNRSVR